MSHKYHISLVASAVRPQSWMRFYESLKGNQLKIEVVFVGPKKPDFALPSNFNYIYATVKPAQCYEIGFRAAQGELVGWTADDCFYNGVNQANLDMLYKFFFDQNERKLVVAQRSIEDGRDIWYRHHFFGDWGHTPIMAPLGFMLNDYLRELGGYDRRFISGQSENDVVMRVLENGGKVVRHMDSYVHIDHRNSHEANASSGVRQYYVADREFLENCWVVGGYGAYGTGGTNLRGTKIEISKTRLIPFEPFSDTDITGVSQEPKGRW